MIVLLAAIVFPTAGLLWALHLGEAHQEGPPKEPRENPSPQGSSLS